MEQGRFDFVSKRHLRSRAVRGLGAVAANVARYRRPVVDEPDLRRVAEAVVPSMRMNR